MNYTQFGFEGLEVKGITIHNTGNNKSAKELKEWFNTTDTNQGCHYLVDDEEIIQIMPLDWCVYHTGKGLDFGNLHTIAIEICKSQSDLDTYLKAQEKALFLVKKLMDKYELTSDKVYFHNSFNERAYCPHRILSLYGSRKEFVRKELDNDI